MASTKPTMKSIAEDLGVSRSTVSFVLAGEAERRRINPETAERILKRAQALGFRPNYFAQALNTRKTGAIGLVFPDVRKPTWRKCCVASTKSSPATMPR